MRRAVRWRSWRTAARSIRRPACSTPIAARPAPCGRRKRRWTIATSPIPDLLPLELDPAWIKAIEASLPELPDAKRARLQSQYGLSPYDAKVLAADAPKADYFEAAAKGRDAKLVANFTTNELTSSLTKHGLEIDASPISAADLGGLVELIQTDVISSKIAKQVFELMWAGEGAPAAIVEKHGLRQVTDTGAIETAIDAIIAANPDKAEAAKRGRKPSAGSSVR